MNILHMVVTLSPLHGGPSRVVPAMCSALTKKGHRAEIITTTWTGRAEASSETGLAVPITYHDVSWPRSFGTSWSLAAEVGRRISEFDVVHVHQVYFFHGVVASTVSAKADVPVVISPHGVFHPFHKKKNPLRKSVYTLLVERRNLSKAAGFHFSSAAERDHATETGLIDGGYVIPFAVDLRADCDVAPFLELHPGLTGKILVTFLGRLTAIKRLDLVIDAFAKVATEHSEAHLVLAGPDSEGLGSALRGAHPLMGVRIHQGANRQRRWTRESARPQTRRRQKQSPSERPTSSLTITGKPAAIPSNAAAHLRERKLRRQCGAHVEALGIGSHVSFVGANAGALVASSFAPATIRLEARRASRTSPVTTMADRLENMYKRLIERGAG